MHVHPICSQSRFVNQLIAYYTLIAVYRVRQSMEPEYLAVSMCRDNKQGNIVMKNTDLVLYRNSFVFRGSVLWNKLPGTLKTQKKISRFKPGLKVWVIENILRFLG